MNNYNFVKTFFFVIALSTLIGCSELSIAPKPIPPVNAKSLGEFCLDDPLAYESYTKFLFIVDKSGSNGTTDPGRTKRADNIRDFIESKRDSDYVQWGLISFSGSTTKAYINDGQDNPAFTEDDDLALNAVEEMRGDGDGGGTPYRAAITAARTAIERDIELYPEQRNFYMVFFISDGNPTDTSNQSELDSLVENLIQVAPNVVLSTAYYGSNGSSAIGRLRRMADVGGGRFVNFENTDNWDFDDLVPEPTVQPWLLKKFLVYNVSAGYCIDGTIDTDSDADGMCDKDELEYGFDPTNRFTNGDGYGDYFHWRAIVHGERLPACDDRSDEDFDLLTYCEEKFIKNLNPPEGIPQNGDPKNPDTDRDGVIDGIEVFVYFQATMAFAMDNTNLSRSQFDGEEDAEKQIDEHRNPLVKDKNFAIAYDTKIERNNFDGRDCYKFSQNVLPLYPTLEVPEGNTLDWLTHKKDGNSVLVYYIQTPKSDPSSNGVYRFSYQNLKRDPVDTITLGPRAGLKVNDRIFETYEAPRR